MDNLNNPVCLWPDGDWCYQCEIEEYTWKSDDYQVMDYSELPPTLRTDYDH